ncbi:hypothetical protein [Paenibacillus sp. 1001270B_150601_E10]|uniref:hypothetical protein n=1 Tax=Paenibacillus sp. 1001270B_150601_E10 TaxID=2787079 RepID=UPI00189F3469|nr:hypothetical protein [Paenibacillus sp. 1001270B_150601_E10]
MTSHVTFQPEPASRAADALLVKQYVIHSLVIDTLKRDMLRLTQASLKMAHLYLAALEQAEQQASASSLKLRREFRQRDIHIHEQERQPHGIRVHYSCKGYEHSFYMLRGLLRSEVTSLMKRYLNLEPSEK